MNITCNPLNFVTFDDLQVGAPFIKFEDVRNQNVEHMCVKVSKVSAVRVSGGLSEACVIYGKLFVFPCKVTRVEIC